MELDGIDVFAEVVNARSFSAAAKRLGMPVSTVSAKVARLEQRLGVTLLHRTTRQLNLTQYGKAYYERCVRALAEMSEAERELADQSQEPTGLLTISAAADLAQFKLIPLIEAYLERYPKTSIDLRVSNRRVDLVAEGIDLAIRSGELEDSSLVVSRYADTRVGLWASQDYVAQHGAPQNIQDLASHRLVHMSRAEDLLKIVGLDEKNFGLADRSRLSCDDLQTVRAFIEEGTGIGVLPDFIGAYRARPLVQVLPEVVSDPISAFFVYPAQQFVPRSLRAFIDLARAHETG
ncbi:MAG: LysR family transcriptional regulator [Hyphomicrobiales bacterium]|nr:LysR family transcriptional regulator [Hyphomicrobiales bacterium]